MKRSDVLMEEDEGGEEWLFRFICDLYLQTPSVCFTGVCPVLCSGHGHYGGGLCHCEEGYKGPECEIPAAECQVPGCSSHGRCIEGECHCDRGFKGNDCSQRKFLSAAFRPTEDFQSDISSPSVIILNLFLSPVRLQPTVWTRHAPATERASTDNVSVSGSGEGVAIVNHDYSICSTISLVSQARPVGRATTAALSISKSISVCRAAPSAGRTT